MIYPVPGPDLWTRTDTRDIDPPVFHRKKGRKPTQRRKGQFEVPKPKDTSRIGTITCSNCGKQGHRYTNCGDPLKPSLAARKNKHKVLNLIAFASNLYLYLTEQLMHTFVLIKMMEQITNLIAGQQNQLTNTHTQ